MKKTIQHPCYTGGHGMGLSRIHLPVARHCNLGCRYCAYGDHEHGVLNPETALQWLEQLINDGECITFAAVAGPGEPLCNDETFMVLKGVKERFPGMKTCLCTNGLEISNRVQDIRLYCDFCTITVNTLNPQTAKKLYSYVLINGEKRSDDDAYEEYIERVKTGVSLLKQTSTPEAVKVNTILFPGINTEEMEELARTVSAMGVEEMNIKHLQPAGTFADVSPVKGEEREELLRACERWLPVFKHCGNCSYEAYGEPGKKDTSLFSTFKDRKVDAR